MDKKLNKEPDKKSNEELDLTFLQKCISPSCALLPSFKFGVTTQTYSFEPSEYDDVIVPDQIVKQVGAYINSWSPTIEFSDIEDGGLTVVKSMDPDFFYYFGEFSAIDIEDRAIVHIRIMFADRCQALPCNKPLVFEEYSNSIQCLRIEKELIKNYDNVQAVLYRGERLNKMYCEEIERLQNELATVIECRKLLDKTFISMDALKHIRECDTRSTRKKGLATREKREKSKTEEGESKTEEGESKTEEGESKTEEGESKTEEGESKIGAKKEEYDASFDGDECSIFMPRSLADISRLKDLCRV